jgi:hypothetical protein
MPHVTSDRYLFNTEHSMNMFMQVGSKELLIALQREHPRIVQRLQNRAATYRNSRESTQ